MANNGMATQSSLALEGELYRIGEVSRMTGVKAFVLRYWETEFPMLEPTKRSNGRFYSEEDVELIRKIKRLLYDEDIRLLGRGGICVKAARLARSRRTARKCHRDMARRSSF